MKKNNFKKVFFIIVSMILLSLISNLVFKNNYVYASTVEKTKAEEKYQKAKEEKRKTEQELKDLEAEMSTAKNANEEKSISKKIESKTEELKTKEKNLNAAKESLEKAGVVIITSNNCVDEVTKSIVDEDSSGYATNICSTTQGFAKVMESFVNTLAGVAGALTVGAIVLGGFQYITSEADPKKLTKAKETIFYGCAGLVVVVCTFFISSLIINAFS